MTTKQIFFKSLCRRYRRRFEIGLAHWLVKASAFSGSLKLHRTKPKKILIDNSVLRHGLTHTNAWISTGTTLWGEEFPIESGYLARVPREYQLKHKNIYEKEIPYFAPIAHLAITGYIKLYSSRELKFEQWRQRSYDPYLFGMNLWSKIKLEQVCDPPQDRKISFVLNKESTSAESQTERILACATSEFREIAKHVGRKNILDVFHIWTAKHAGCEIFLTTDFKIKNVLKSLPDVAKKKLHPVQVLSPSEFGKSIGLLPIPHQLLTPIDSEWFYEMRR